MNSTIFTTKQSQNHSKLNVFDRLTKKKISTQSNKMTKSHINTKQKLPISSHPQTSRSTIGPSTIDRKQQKQVQKMVLITNKYSNLIFPVQYAEQGLVIEIQKQPQGNTCRIQMDYNQYDILINEIQHHFTMPIMQMSIKMIKVILSEEAFPKSIITITRMKGKIRQDKIQTNNFFNPKDSKDIIEINPFKEIQESQIRRKKMLLNIPKLKMQKIHSKTQIDEIEADEHQSKLLVKQIDKPKKYLNKSQLYFSPSSRRTMIKKDVFKLMTPRSQDKQFVISDKLRYEQIMNKKLTLNLQQTMEQISFTDLKKDKPIQKQNKNSKHQPIQGKINDILSTKAKTISLCSPRRA